MTLRVSDPTAFVLADVAARGVPVESELLVVSMDGRELEVRELQADPLNRLQLFESSAGILTIDYSAVVVDSTRLAPRSGMVRMATGRDATDTAFLTNTLADIELLTLYVEATADQTFSDDADELVELS